MATAISNAVMLRMRTGIAPPKRFSKIPSSVGDTVPPMHEARLMHPMTVPACVPARADAVSIMPVQSDEQDSPVRNAAVSARISV